MSPFNTERDRLNINSINGGKISRICEEDILTTESVQCFSRSFLQDIKKGQWSRSELIQANWSFLLLHPFLSPCFFSWVGLPGTLNPKSFICHPKQDCASFSEERTPQDSENCGFLPTDRCSIHSQPPFPPPCSPSALGSRIDFSVLTWGKEGSLPQPLDPDQEETPLHASAQRASRKQMWPLLPPKLADCSWQGETEPMRRKGLGKTEFSKNKDKALNKYTNCTGWATRKTVKETHWKISKEVVRNTLHWSLDYY